MLNKENLIFSTQKAKVYPQNVLIVILFHLLKNLTAKLDECKT